MRRIITSLGLACIVALTPGLASAVQPSAPPGQEITCSHDDGWVKIETDTTTEIDVSGLGLDIDWTGDDGASVAYDVADGFNVDLCVKSGTGAFSPGDDGTDGMRETQLNLTGEGSITLDKDVSHFAYRLRQVVDCGTEVSIDFDGGLFEEGTFLTLDVDSSLVGETVDVSVTGQNNDSVHPDNDLIVASGGAEVTLLDVERESGATTEADGPLTLGSTVTVALSLGTDDVFSGGLTLTFTCPTPPVVPPTTPPVIPPVPPKPPVPPVTPDVPVIAPPMTLERQAAEFATENPGSLEHPTTPGALPFTGIEDVLPQAAGATLGGGTLFLGIAEVLKRRRRP